MTAGALILLSNYFFTVIVHGNTACRAYIQATHRSVLSDVYGVLSHLEQLWRHSNLFLAQNDYRVLIGGPLVRFQINGIFHIIHGNQMQWSYLFRQRVKSLHQPIQRSTMYRTNVVVSTNSTTTIVLLRPVDKNSFSQESISVPDASSNIKVIV